MRIPIVLFATLLMLNPPFSNENLPRPTISRAENRGDLVAKLDKRVDFRTSRRTLIQILVGLAYDYQVPMGIEYVNSEAKTQQIDLYFHNEPLRLIIKSIIAQLPQYAVDFGEAVQIYSPQARRNPSNLLNRSIKEYSAVDADTEEAGLELACSLSRELTPGAFCGGSIAAGQWGPVKVTLHVQNARVYEILDAIVGQNGEAIWVVTTPTERLSKMQVGGLWHIYPLQPPFKTVVLDKLEDVKQ